MLLIERYAHGMCAERKFVCFVSVSAVEILIASNVNIDISMIKHESSRQYVKYN